MKFVLASIFSTAAVVVMLGGCRTTGPANESSGSGLSEISVPLPEQVAKNLGSGGTAELTAKNNDGSDRIFRSPVTYSGGENAGSSIIFDVDQARQGLRVGDQLSGITLYLRDEANNPIYIGQGKPANITMQANVNEINFDLTCARSAAALQKCNGLENVTVVAIQGGAGTTSASIKANISIKSDGSTFVELRENVVKCMETFNKHRTCSFWRDYSSQGESACHELANKEVELNQQKRIADLQSYIASLESIDALQYYVDVCKRLGIFR